MRQQGSLRLCSQLSSKSASHLWPVWVSLVCHNPPGGHNCYASALCFCSADLLDRVSDTLFDLRGMRVEVSVIAVRVAVLDTMVALEAEGIQERRVVFITGPGARSQNGALLRPAVPQLVEGSDCRTEAGGS